MKFQQNEFNKLRREVIFEVDNNDIITDVTDNIEKILKYKKESVIGKNIREIYCDGKKQEGKVTLLDNMGNFELYDVKFLNHRNDDDKTLSYISIYKVDCCKTKEGSKCMIKNIYEGLNDLVYSLRIKDRKINVMYVNDMIEDLLGYSLEEAYNNEDFIGEIIYEDDKAKLKQKLINKRDEMWIVEVRLKHKEGHYIWMEILAVPSIEEDGKGLFLRGIGRCIEKRKKKEKEIEDIMYNDNLTKLRNRNYLQEKIEEIKDKEFSVIIVDIDNLKELNDTRGHLEGDKLILKAANILKKVFKDDCVKFRMGGDEFMIIIKNSSEDYVKSKIDELDLVIEDSNKNSDIIVSLSKGYSICKKSGEDIVRVMDKADYYMYRDKRSKR